MLSKQRDKTGFAILGQPPPEIIIDKKLEGSTFAAAKTVGEGLACQALTAEIFVLISTQIPQHEYRQYIGRS